MSGFDAKQESNELHDESSWEIRDDFSNVDRDKSDLFEGFIGVIVDIEIAAKGAVFVSSGSTFSDLIESIGRFSKDTVIKPRYHYAFG